MSTAIRPMTMRSSVRVKPRPRDLGLDAIEPSLADLAIELGVEATDAVLEIGVDIAEAEVAVIASAVGVIIVAVADVHSVIAAHPIDCIVATVAEEVIV